MKLHVEYYVYGEKRMVLSALVWILFCFWAICFGKDEDGEKTRDFKERVPGD